MNTSAYFSEVTKKLVNKQNLSRDEMGTVIEELLTNEHNPVQVAALLSALTTKGETIDEISAAALSMQKYMKPFDAPPNSIDIVGTGGDNLNTWNISTASSIVVAASGVTVAKHGNKSSSSKCGSADVLDALSINCLVPPSTSQVSIQKYGFAFLFAPVYHPLIAKVSHIRKTLAFRTIFNLLGPTCNPANVDSILLGVNKPHLTHTIAQVLLSLNVQNAWVIHAHAGLDELCPYGDNIVVGIKNGSLFEKTVSASDFSLKPIQSIQPLIGNSKIENAEKIKSLLQGEMSPFHTAVIMNSAAALHIANVHHDLSVCAEIAKQSISSNKALQLLLNLQSVYTHV